MWLLAVHSSRCLASRGGDDGAVRFSFGQPHPISSSMEPVVLLTPYASGASAMGGAGFIDARLEKALQLSGFRVETLAVSGPQAPGILASELQLRVQGDKVLLARTAARMLATGEPYNVAKFRIFKDVWRQAQERLRSVVAGRALVASGWLPLLLCRDAGVKERLYVGHNLEWQVSATYGPLPLRMLRDSSRSRRTESRAVRQVTEALFLSATDAADARADGLPGRSMPLGLTWREPRTVAGRKTLGLIGSMSWPANQAAAALLVGPLRAKLRALDHDVHIILAGHGSEAFAGPGVTTLGAIGDVEEFYSLVDAVVVPRFDQGTGVSVKMLEAWEAGVGVFADAGTVRAVLDVAPPQLAFDVDQLAHRIKAWQPVLPSQQALERHSLARLANELAVRLPRIAAPT